MNYVILVLSLGLSFVMPTGTSEAVSCNTNCAKVASFNYLCPTFGNPGRKCKGREPATFTSCETVKAAKCRLWAGLANDAVPLVKPYMESQYNQENYEKQNHQAYMIECTAAATSALATIATMKGGPWAGLAGGAVGLFISKRVCEQSTKW